MMLKAHKILMKCLKLPFYNYKAIPKKVMKNICYQNKDKMFTKKKQYEISCKRIHIFKRALFSLSKI